MFFFPLGLIFLWLEVEDIACNSEMIPEIIIHPEVSFPFYFSLYLRMAFRSQHLKTFLPLFLWLSKQTLLKVSWKDKER